MARRKDRELFEILKQSRKRRQRLEDEWRQKELVQTQPDVSPPAPASPPAVPRPDTRATITLRQDTCILGLIGFIFLLIIACIAGYYKGGNDARISSSLGLDVAEEIADDNDSSSSPPRVRSAPKKAVKKKTSPSPTQRRKPVKLAKGVWTLRIWTGSKRATQSARELHMFMRTRGFDAWTKTDKEGIKVFVGGFASRSDPEAVKTRNEVRRLVYKGSRPFQDCYFVREE